MAGFSHIFSDRQRGRSNSWLSLERSSWALTWALVVAGTHSVDAEPNQSQGCERGRTGCSDTSCWARLSLH